MVGGQYGREAAPLSAARHAHIVGWGTAVPPHRYAQEDIGAILGRDLEPGSRNARFLDLIYRQSGISWRHSVIPDWRTGKADGVFFKGEEGRWLSPSTGERNAIYEREAPGLFEQAARQAMDGIAPETVTHVITVSCTGFFAPGPDFVLAQRLGLRPGVERYHLGFMGCYAALPALKMARQFVLAQDDAVVLVVCAELCTLHLQSAGSLDSMIAASVFADGAAATGVAAAPLEGAFRRGGFASFVAPDSEADMAWRIGDRGFDMILSTYVPDILKANIRGIVESLGLVPGEATSADSATGDGTDRESRVMVDTWAVHPGGRAILDKVTEGLGLTAATEAGNGGTATSTDPLAPSREVLDRYGNMSSPTILFVLHALRKQPPKGREDRVCAMAFGPGLTVETMLLTRT